jgi:hypothetical protein
LELNENIIEKISQPDACAPELLHGMLFANIQLNDFLLTLARSLELIEIEGAKECEWIMTAAVNIGGVLEYGHPSSVLHKIGGVGARDTGASGPAVKVVKKSHDAWTWMTKAIHRPVSFKLVMELVFLMLCLAVSDDIMPAAH